MSSRRSRSARRSPKSRDTRDTRDSSCALGRAANQYALAVATFESSSSTPPLTGHLEGKVTRRARAGPHGLAVSTSTASTRVAPSGTLKRFASALPSARRRFGRGVRVPRAHRHQHADAHPRGTHLHHGRWGSRWGFGGGREVGGLSGAPNRLAFFSNFRAGYAIRTRDSQLGNRRNAPINTISCVSFQGHTCFHVSRGVPVRRKKV